MTLATYPPMMTLYPRRAMHGRCRSLEHLQYTTLLTQRATSPSTYGFLPGMALRSLQRTCTVHIVELGYTSVRSLASSITRKRHQHNLLSYFLLEAGWSLPSNCPLPACLPSTLPPPSHLHTDDPSSQPDSPLPPHHIHSVRCAMSILKARRQLEHNPLTFANHPRYTEPSFASSSTS
jgi:hypothetical protein